MRCYTNNLGIKREAWEEFVEDPPKRVFFAELGPIGELRDDMRPQPTEDLKVMTYIF
ncbi:Retrovirus-related Pol polyprotein from transposon 297 family [Sesbania bispinosa]|nr:Retrovirus-related Pol polyprotein from transposon 297 family [Sesbania bispinosa]